VGQGDWGGWEVGGQVGFEDAARRNRDSRSSGKLRKVVGRAYSVSSEGGDALPGKAAIGGPRRARRAAEYIEAGARSRIILRALRAPSQAIRGSYWL
jgi:nucleoid-associated protein YgaU